MNESATVAVGSTVSAKATKAWPTTAKVTYTSDKPEIATVDAATGEVTGVKAGEATITTTLVCGTETVTATTKVTVKNAIKSFTAKTPKKLEVVFAGELATVAKENFTLVDANGAKVAIQKATLGEDKKTVTLDLYGELTTATTYTVTAKIGDDTLTESLNFVKGAVAKIVAANQVVKADAPQTIKYTVYDENGLDITDSTPVSINTNVTVTNGQVTLANGVLIYVTISYVNPTTGAEIKSDTFTVTGSNSVAASISAITIGDATVANVASWPATTNTSVASNATGASAKVVSALWVDQYGNKSVTGATFESLDPSVFVVDAVSGKITPIAEGSGQLKVSKDSVSQIFTVTVTAPAKATSLSVDSSSVLKASMTNKTVNRASVKVNVLDQNQKTFTSDSTSNGLTFTLTSGAGVVSVINGGTDNGDGTITATAGTPVVFEGVKAGTAIFKVTSGNAALSYIMVSITVYALDETIVKYDLQGVKDLNIQDCYDGDANTNDYKTTITLVPVNKDGFVVGNTDVTSGASITITKPDKSTFSITSGTKLCSANDGVDTTVNVSDLGTYSIVATKQGVTIASASFTVKDTGVAPVVTIKKNTVAYNTVSSDFTTNFEAADGYIVTGVKFISGNSSIIASNTTASASLSKGSSTGDVTLYNVVVVVTKTTGTVTRTFTVPTNQQIVVTGVQ